MELRPPAVSNAAGEAVDLAASVGLLLDDWQAYVLAGALGETVDGRWAAFEVGVDVPRQNGKGAILEARELAGLWLFGERLQVHTAHQFATALEAFRRVLQLIEGSDLGRDVRRVVRSHGEEGIELRSGQRLLFRARSNGAGRGLSGDLVVLDEAMFVTADMMAGLMPTLSARPNPQLWLTGSAGFGASGPWQRMRRRAVEGDGRLSWCGWGNRADVAADDADGVRRANPALGVRLSEEFSLTERAAMSWPAFRRERLGVWDADESQVVAERVIPADRWAGCADPLSSVVDVPCFAVDVSPDRRWSSIAVAGRSASGRVHVEVVDRREGVGWVVDRVVELVGRWAPRAVVLDPAGPAGPLLSGLRGVSVLREVSGRELAQACGGLLDLVMGGVLVHLGDGACPALGAAVAGAARRQVGESWAWSRRSADVDLSPLVAVTLAAWAAGAVDQAPKARPVMVWA